MSDTVVNRVNRNLSNEVVIYTDGGASPNPGYGGWAAILRYGKEEEILRGNEKHTTNNRMELTAATRALQALRRPRTVDLYTDSQYLKQGITQWIEKWLAKGQLNRCKKQVKNADLWLDLYLLTKYHTVTWHWVRGHHGDVLNERVDRLVHVARSEILPTYAFERNALTLFVKGSCKKQLGGWAVLLEAGQKTERFSGNAMTATSNQMELMAAVEGLSQVETGKQVWICTESDYLHQGITSWVDGWQKEDWKRKDGQPVANTTLWKRLINDVKRVQVTWVNGRGQEIPQFDVVLKMAQAAINQ